MAYKAYRWVVAQRPAVDLFAGATAGLFIVAVAVVMTALI
jgi:hypothetical protein